MPRQLPVTFRDLIRYGLIIIGSLALVGYALWQARLLIIGPVITLTEEPTTVQSSRSVTLSGTTANITTLSLNGQTIYTDKSGQFNEILILENGYSLMTLKATDRYGRTTELTKPFVYTNPDSSG